MHVHIYPIPLSSLFLSQDFSVEEKQCLVEAMEELFEGVSKIGGQDAQMFVLCCMYLFLLHLVGIPAVI